jgi:hypothetical protein
MDMPADVRSWRGRGYRLMRPGSRRSTTFDAAEQRNAAREPFE